MPRSLPPHVLAVTAGDPDAVRHYILEAAHRVIGKKGLAAASTRAVADEAGLSGSTLYNYFASHVQLLARSIVHHVQSVMDPVAELPARAGSDTVADNLAYFAHHAAAILDQ